MHLYQDYSSICTARAGAKWQWGSLATACKTLSLFLRISQPHTIPACPACTANRSKHNEIHRPHHGVHRNTQSASQNWGRQEVGGREHRSHLHMVRSATASHEWLCWCCVQQQTLRQHAPRQTDHVSHVAWVLQPCSTAGLWKNSSRQKPICMQRVSLTNLRPASSQVNLTAVGAVWQSCRCRTHALCKPEYRSLPPTKWHPVYVPRP